MDKIVVCKATGLILESQYDYIFWTHRVIHNLNMVQEEIDNKVSWIKEFIGKVRDIVKFIANHQQCQAIFQEYFRLQLLKVFETIYTLNFIMLHYLIDVKKPLASMAVSQL